MRNDFGKLKRKIIRLVLLSAVFMTVLGSLLMSLLVDGLLQAPFAKGFVYLCERLLRFDDYQARELYQQVFRDYKYVWVFIGGFVLVLCGFYFILARIVRYFNEVSTGIDKLVEESTDVITLSPEMEAMEKKLNAVKYALEKRAREAKEAEQRKNDLVMYLAHDIRTPLTSVIGYLSLLDEAPDMPAEQKAKYIGITLDKAYRLEQLINEFFDITRFNLQSMMLNKEVLHLPFMLEQIADEFYPMLEPQGKKIIVQAAADLMVEGDADKLARVFHNILKNAIAYSYDQTTIEMAAQEQGKQVVITFSNQGKAIPENKLNTIFEKFYRLDTSRSSHTGGAGLGLAIAKEIVVAHEGTIGVESDPYLTVFTVSLPSLGK